MTVKSTETRITYAGNGVATRFAIPFAFLSASHLVVARIDSSGERHTLTSDYFVDTVANVVIYPGYSAGQEPPESEQPPILPTGEQLLIYRSTPRTQETDLPGQEILSSIETMDDKAMMVIQELGDDVGESTDLSYEVRKLVNQAIDSANQALGISRAANETANNALTIANNAKETAEGIEAKADEAIVAANNAITNSENALAIASGISGIANNALTIATDAKAIVNATDSRVGSLETIVSGHTSEMTAKWIILNTLENRINGITGVPSFDSSDADMVLTVSSSGSSIGWEPIAAATGSKVWRASMAVIVGQVLYPTDPASPLAFECIQAGTTGTVEPTGNVMQAVTDGTVKWGIFDIRKRTPELDGSFELKNWTTPKNGYHVANGATLTSLSANYPSLYQALQGGDVPFIDMNSWTDASSNTNSGIGGVPYFGYDGGDTCILPDVRDMYFRGSGTYNVQDYHGDAIRNILGSFQAANATAFHSATGAFIQAGTGAYMPVSSNAGTLLGIQMYFNAKESGVPTGPENVPKTIVQLPVVFTGYKVV